MSEEIVSARLDSPSTAYDGVTFSHRTVNHFLIYTAEAALVGRTHRRAILALSGDTRHLGKPLFYGDAYVASGQREPETFVYARHRCDNWNFFIELNGFLEKMVSEYPEFRRRKFPAMLCLGDRSGSRELPIPFVLNKQMLEEATFFRLDLPFGALTVEFGRQVPEEGNQLENMRLKQLTSRLESPLLGVDFTNGDLYKPLMLQVHWAADFIPRNALEDIINDLAATSIYA
jgi:hypothetical protein